MESATPGVTPAKEWEWSPWIVIVCCFLVYGMSNSFVMSLHVFTESIIKEYQVSYKQVAITCTLGYALICSFTPIAMFCIHKFGLRRTLFANGLVIFACLISAVYIRNYASFVILIGVIAACCFCTFSSGGIIVGGYILPPHQQHIGFSITSTGTGVGLMIQPLAAKTLIGYFGFRQTLLIYAAIYLNLCAFSMIFPLKLQSISSNNNYENKKDVDNNSIENLEIELLANNSTLENQLEKRSECEGHDNNSSIEHYQSQEPIAVDSVVIEQKAIANNQDSHFHLEILRTKAFWFLGIYAAVFGLLQNVMNAFNTSILEQNYGMDLSTVSTVVSLTSAMNIAGRLSTSYFKKTSHIPRWWIWAWINVILGLSVLAFGVSTKFWTAVVGQLVYFFTMGQSMTMYYVILADSFTEKQYYAAMSYGLFCWATGIAWTPVAGWLRDVTNSFTLPCILFGGTFSVLSTCCVLYLPLTVLWQKAILPLFRIPPSQLN